MVAVSAVASPFLFGSTLRDGSWLAWRLVWWRSSVCLVLQSRGNNEFGRREPTDALEYNGMSNANNVGKGCQ